MKRILILVFNDLTTDVRVQRQIDALRERHELTVVSFGGLHISGIQWLNLDTVRLGMSRKILIAITLILRLYKQAYWLLFDFRMATTSLRNKGFDVVIANDVETLPLAYDFKSVDTKIVLDAHEYATRQFEGDWKWKLFRKGLLEYISRNYIPKVDDMITQNELFAQEFEEQYGVHPKVVINAPEYTELEPIEKTEGVIKIVHHGIYNTSRNLEKLIDVMDQLNDRFELHLMLHLPVISNEQSRMKFGAFKERASLHGRITIMDPVAGPEVVRTIHQYDLGLHILEPISFNHKYSLPNKILEFIQARLGVVIGPSPGMVHIVEKYGVGVVAEDFSSQAIADAILSISGEQLNQLKRNSHEAAKELSSEEGMKVVREVVG